MPLALAAFRKSCAHAPYAREQCGYSVGVFRDSLVLRRLVKRLPRPAGPLVEQRRERLELLSLQDEADLSREAGEVTRLPQQHRIRLLDEPPLQIAVLEIAAVAILVQPRHHAAAARHADRRRVVVIREPHALARQPVEMRRDDVLVPIAASRPAGLIVGEQEDDVGPLGGLRDAGC